MEKIDFRTLDESTRFVFRKRSIELIKSGKKKGEVALLVGVKPGTISSWWKSYQQAGLKGLKAKCQVSQGC
ncbi:MAG: helix-turn-helix domain-containing protein [Paludibacteraceae bacterium]